MKRNFAKEVRSKLGLSQRELSKTLRVSLKAVQSYEQGWRNLPESVALHLISLLAVHAGRHRGARPCWSLTRCPSATRKGCPAYLVSRGRFCWLLGGTACANEGAAKCLKCAVVRRLVA